MRRSTVLAGLTAVTLLAGWAGSATWFLMKRDDLASRLITRETSRQYAYEDRIASLRHEVERLAGRQLVDQDGVESRLSELMTRQGQLESRQAIVAALTEQLGSQPAVTGSAKPVGRTAALSASSHAPVQAGMVPQLPANISSYVAPLKPTPEADLPALRGSDAQRGKPGGWNSSNLLFGPPIEERLGDVSRALGRIDTEQLRVLNRIEQRVTARRSELRQIVAATGLDADRLMPATGSSAGAQGGPFVPFKVDPKAGPFEAALVRIQPTLVDTARLQRLTRALPIERPLPAQFETTSTFGYRSDPFTRAAAMHTGIDFRAETGTSVRATGPGKVITSGYQGGYGNMVEIDHGMGLTTRYAHLSALLVDEGETVQTGAIIGRVGSTGRSTGPHLHYETRLEDEALDPRRFLKAGEKVTAALP